MIQMGLWETTFIFRPDQNGLQKLLVITFECMPRKRNIYNVDFDNQQQDQENIKKNLLITNYMIRGRQEGNHFK